MHALILGAVAALITAGRGDGATAPLRVATDPPGATAMATYRNWRGNLAVTFCATPCTLRIPQRAPFVLEVTRDGRAARIPPVAWKPTLLGAELRPNAITATFEP